MICNGWDAPSSSAGKEVIATFPTGKKGQNLHLFEEELLNPSGIFPVLPADDSKQVKKYHGFEEVGQWWKWVTRNFCKMKPLLAAKIRVRQQPIFGSFDHVIIYPGGVCSFQTSN